MATTDLGRSRRRSCRYPRFGSVERLAGLGRGTEGDQGFFTRIQVRTGNASRGESAQNEYRAQILTRRPASKGGAFSLCESATSRSNAHCNLSVYQLFEDGDLGNGVYQCSWRLRLAVETNLRQLTEEEQVSFNSRSTALAPNHRKNRKRRGRRRPRPDR